MVSNHRRYLVGCLVAHHSAVGFVLGMMTHAQMHHVPQKPRYRQGPVEFEPTEPIQHDHIPINHLMHCHDHATKILQSRLWREKQHVRTELQETYRSLDIVGERHL